LRAGSIKVRPRSTLGVQYVSVTIKRLELQPFSLLWTDTSLDETHTHMADRVVMLAKPGEAETTLRRRLNEHRQSQKRVNALKNSIIPSDRETIRAIGAALEEEERSALFQMKVLRESR
jgi:V/A-type H+-transporting ATPase subunit D